MENDTYIDELNQLRDHQVAVVDTIDKIRDEYKGQIPADLERIQGEALKIVHDIDEIRERRNDELRSRQFSRRNGRPAPQNPETVQTFFGQRL